MAAPGNVIPPIIVGISGDISDLVRAVEEAKILIEEFARERQQAKLALDVNEVKEQVAAAKQALVDFNKETAEARLSVTTGTALTEIGAIDEALRSIKDHTNVTIKVDVDGVTQAIADLKAVRDLLIGLGQRKPKIDIRSNVPTVLEELQKVQDKLVDLHEDYADINLNTNTGTTLSDLQAIKSEIDSIPNEVVVNVSARTDEDHSQQDQLIQSFQPLINLINGLKQPIELGKINVSGINKVLTDIGAVKTELDNFAKDYTARVDVDFSQIAGEGKKAVDEFLTFYHGTIAEHVPYLFEEGIQPRHAEVNENVPTVSLTQDADLARLFGNSILELQIPKRWAEEFLINLSKDSPADLLYRNSGIPTDKGSQSFSYSSHFLSEETPIPTDFIVRAYEHVRSIQDDVIEAEHVINNDLFKDVDSTSLAGNLSELTALIEGLRTSASGKPIKLVVGLDAPNLQDDLKRIRREVDNALDDKMHYLHVAVILTNVTEFQQRLNSLKDEIKNSLGNVEVGVAPQIPADIQTTLNDLPKTSTTIKVVVDTGSAALRLTNLKNKLDDLDGRTVEATVKLLSDDAKSEMASLNDLIKEYDGTVVSATADLQTTRFNLHAVGVQDKVSYLNSLVVDIPAVLQGVDDKSLLDIDIAGIQAMASSVDYARERMLAAKEASSAFYWGSAKDLKRVLEQVSDTIDQFKTNALDLNVDLNLPSIMAKIAEVQMLLKADPLSIDVVGHLEPLMTDIAAALQAEQALVAEEQRAKRWTSDLAAAKNELASIVSAAASIKYADNTDEIWMRAEALLRMIETADYNLDFKADFNQAMQDLRQFVMSAQAQARLIDVGSIIQSKVTTVEVPVEAKTSKALAEIESLKAAAAGGGGGGGGFWSGLLGDITGDPGRGVRIPGTRMRMPALAAGGSIGALMGLGPEHLIMTAGGLLGSLAGGAVGGGLLATAGLTTTAVGMGTDLAGVGQATKNARNISKAMEARDKAAETYGANSRQAQTAQKQLDYAKSYVTPVAQQATTAYASAIHNLGESFKLLTGQAQKTGAEIGTQFVGAFQKFVPVIGKFAGQNMSILKTSLQPFLGWLQDSGKSGGLGIFTQLEVAFQKNLPTSIHAVTGAFELFMKTISHIVSTNGVGGLMKGIDNFVTRMNTVDFNKWMSGVDSLIRQFHVWLGFFKVLGADIFDILKLSSGLAVGTKLDPTGIIPLLTQNLEHLHHVMQNILQGAGGGKGSALGQIFEGHKQQVLTLIQLVIQLGTSFGKAYIAAAPTFIALATIILKVALAISTLVQKMPGGSWVLGITLLASKMGILGPLLGGAAEKAGALGKAMGWIGKVSGIQSMTTAITDFAGAQASAAKGAVGKGLKFAIGITEDGMSNKGIAGLFDTIKTQAGVAALNAKDGIKRAFSTVAGDIKGIFSRTKTDEGGFLDIGKLKGKIGELASSIKSGLGNAASAVSSFATTNAGRLKQFASNSVSAIGSFAATAGGQIAEFAKTGVTKFASMATSAAQFAAGFAKQIATGVKSLIVFAIEHAAVAATFIAENIAMAATATAAFIAENAATLGIVAGLAALVAGIVWVATHWHQVWTDIKNWVKDAYNWIHHIFTDGILGDILSLIFPIIGLATHWQEVWGLIKRVTHDAWVVIQDVWHAIVAGAKALWQGIMDYINLCIDIFIKFPIKILSYVADAGSWLLKTGEHIVEGLINGIGNMAGKLMDKIKGLAGSIIHGIGSFLGIASPSTITTKMGSDLTQGLANGIVNNAQSASDAAKRVSDNIKRSFGSLNATGDVAKSIGNLQSIFAKLGHTFDTLGNTAKSSQGIGLSLAAISIGLRQLSDTVSKGGLAKDINDVNEAFSSIVNSKGLTQIQTTLGNVGHVFDVIGRTAQSASVVTYGAIMNMVGAMGVMNQAAPLLSAGISTMINQFLAIGPGLAPVGPLMDSALTSIQSSIGKMGRVFDTFGRTAASASAVSKQGAQDIVNAIVNISGAVPWIVIGLELMDRSLGKVKFKPLYDDLNHLIDLFHKIDDVFKGISGAASDSASVTQPALDKIKNAIKAVVDTINGIPLQVYAANGTIIRTLQALLNNILQVFNGTTTFESFSSIGQNMMQGLAAGINVGSSAVQAAATQSAFAAMGAMHSVTRPGSPSRTYTEEGLNWMQGLENGIRNNTHLVHNAMLSVPPSVGPLNRLAPVTSGGARMSVTANFTINAPGGDAHAIKRAIQNESAQMFAQQLLISTRAGAGTVY